jgi:DNA polymerase-3 subunit alpha
MEGHRPEGGVAIAPTGLDAHEPVRAGRARAWPGAWRRGPHDLAEQQLADWQRVFGDGLHLELTRTGRDGEEAFNQFALMAAGQRGLPVVASNDVRFLAATISTRTKRACASPPAACWTTPSARANTARAVPEVGRGDGELFADIPDAIDNTLALAQRCNIEMRLGTYSCRNSRCPTTRPWTLDPAVARRPGRAPGEESAGAGQDPRGLRRAAGIRARHHHQDGLPGYFLIVADFIQWGKNHGIPIGPGRGSGAGSLVAWALKITDLDPLPYNLLFERFLNPERVSMPDFDIDFCMDRRDEVIDYVARKYGRDRVSQIITYGTMAAKAVVRDRPRARLPVRPGRRRLQADPEHPGIHAEGRAGQGQGRPRLGDGLGRTDRALRDEDDVRDLIDLALQLEDLTRNAGKHAGGVVIAPAAERLLPAVRRTRRGGLGKNPVTQFDKDDVEAVGLVKFDFLGLRTLTIIDWAVKAINKRHARRHPAGGHRRDPARRRAHLRHLRQRQHRRGVPVRILGHAPPAEGRQARPLRRPDRAGALYRPGPMDLIPPSSRASTARRRSNIPIRAPKPC